MNARFDDFLCTYWSRLAFAVAVALLCCFGISSIFISLSLALNCCILIESFPANTAPILVVFPLGKDSSFGMPGMMVFPAKAWFNSALSLLLNLLNRNDKRESPLVSYSFFKALLLLYIPLNLSLNLPSSMNVFAF